MHFDGVVYQNVARFHRYLPKAKIVLQKVMVILSVRSPSNRNEKMLLSPPPGQQPIRSKPNADSADSENATDIMKAN